MTQEQVDEYWDEEYYKIVERDYEEEQEYLKELDEFASSNIMIYFSYHRDTVIHLAKEGNTTARDAIKYYEQYIKQKDQWSFGLFRDRLLSLADVQSML